MDCENNYCQPVCKSLNGENIIEYSFKKEEIIIYQLEMITNNKISGLLNDEIRLSFDITSLIPIKKLFERREFNRDDFFNILNQTVSLLESMEEYLLDVF